MIVTEYTYSIEGLIWVITQFSETCERNYHYITLCEAYITMFAFLDAQPQHANPEINLTLEKFQNEKTHHISNLKSTYQALREFRAENKLNYEHIIQWLKISPELASQYDDYLMLEINANKEFTDYVKQELNQIWQRHAAKLIHNALANWRCDQSIPGLANSFIRMIQSCDFNIFSIPVLYRLSIVQVFAVREQGTVR